MCLTACKKNKHPKPVVAGQNQQYPYKDERRSMTVTVGEEFGIELETFMPMQWYLLTIGEPNHNIIIPLIRTEAVKAPATTKPLALGAPIRERWVFRATEKNLVSYLWPIVFVQKGVRGGPIYTMLHIDVTVLPKPVAEKK